MVRLRGLVEIVGRVDHGHPARRLLVEEVVDRAGGDDVEARHRLVEQQHVVVLGEALGHVGALALAAGELVEVPPRQVRDLHALHGGPHDVPVLLPEPAEPPERGVPAHPDDVAHRHRHALGHADGLHHEGGALRAPPRVLAEHLQRTGGRVAQARQGGQQRGLAGAVGPDHRDQPPGRQGEVGVPDGHVRAVAQFERPGDREGRRGRRGARGEGRVHRATSAPGRATTGASCSRCARERTCRPRSASTAARTASTTKNSRIGMSAMVAEPAVPSR